MNINKRGLNKIIQEEIAKELDETFRNRYGSRRSERSL